MLDSSGDVLSLARLYLGRDMNSQSAADLDAAEAVLKSVRPYVRYFHSSQYVNDLATGEICIAVGWVNGVHQARARAGEMAPPVEVAYVVPKEGAPIWIDFMAIPVDAANPDAAHAFLNYLMEPEVIAGVSNAVGQFNAVVAATQFVDEKIRNDPDLYPTPEVMRRLRTYTPVSEEFSRMTNRAWTRIKSAQ
jgi:putrescine transport system substrate-binding protein